jgi:general secretion pathway protein A
MDKRPFSLAVDLSFLYLSEEHTRIFGEIISALQRRDGLVCVTGEAGAGKTVICRRLLEELNEEYKVVLVTTPPRSPRDMTEMLDDAFGEIEADSRIPVVIFDEAQHLDFPCLDQVKFLTNLEKNGEKLLQIVLVGQPELAEKISRRRFTQLEQRIGAKLKLGPLKKREVLPYLNHRLSAAGLSKEISFTALSARRFYRQTGGVPRLINRVANIAVEHALLDGRGKIGVAEVKRAVSKVGASRGGWDGDKSRSSLPLRVSIFLVLLVIVSAGLFFYYKPRIMNALGGSGVHSGDQVRPSAEGDNQKPRQGVP